MKKKRQSHLYIPEWPNQNKEAWEYALDNKQTVCIQSDKDDEQPRVHHHHCSQDRKLRAHVYSHSVCKPKIENKTKLGFHVSKEEPFGLASN